MIRFGTQQPSTMSIRQYLKFHLKCNANLFPIITVQFYAYRFGWCRCDRDCGIYGDCCMDAATMYDIGSKLTSSWICLLMSTETDYYAADQNVSWPESKYQTPSPYEITLFSSLISFHSSFPLFTSSPFSYTRHK